MRIGLLVGMIVFLAPGCVIHPAGESIAFENVDFGFTASDFPEPEERVIDSVEEWQKLWIRIQRSTISPQPLPTIDFSKFQVVAVFAGEQPSGGYEIRIVRVEKVADAVIVYTSLTQPESGAVTVQLLTYPYHIVKMERTGLPIQFEQTR